MPRRVYTRTITEPHPAGVPGDDIATYAVSRSELTLTFGQSWLDADRNGVINLYSGTRIETYERLASPPK